MKLIIKNPSSDQRSYVSGTVVVQPNSQLEVAEDSWFSLSKDIEFVKDIRLNNIYLNDGIQDYSTPRSEEYLVRLTESALGSRDSQGNIVFSQKEIPSIYAFHDLIRQSNGSRNMNVSGSLAVPVDYEFAPAQGETWHIERLLFGIDDVGLTDMGLFGGITALPNGLLITVKTRGQIYTIGKIKDNVDIAMIFPGTTLGQSGVLDTADGMCGSLMFQNKIHLTGDSQDYIRISVRDDLRGINILRSMVVARRIV